MLLFLLIFLPYASIYKTFLSLHISLSTCYNNNNNNNNNNNKFTLLCLLANCNKPFFKITTQITSTQHILRKSYITTLYQFKPHIIFKKNTNCIKTLFYKHKTTVNLHSLQVVPPKSLHTGCETHDDIATWLYFLLVQNRYNKLRTAVRSLYTQNKVG